MQKIKLIFYGGVGATTGANFMLEAEGAKFLVDCGLLQGTCDADMKNVADFAYDPSEAKALFVTHAHIDHIGRIPKLVKDGFKGKIFSTPETKAISAYLLEDAYKIMASKEKKGGVSHLLYEVKHIKGALDLWQTKDYGQKFEEGGIRVIFRDAGHILGSAMVEIEAEGGKIIFTGDLGNSPSLLLRDTEEIKDADYVVMESVYGDRNHESKDERREKLKKVISEAIKRKGEIVIPAFAVERTQVLLYELNNMVEEGEIESVPVFLDSPLAEKVTGIYKNSTHLFNEHIKKEIASGDNIFDFSKLKIVDSIKESVAIDKVPNPKIIIAGSGMSEGGRVLNHEYRILNNADNTLLLVGYQGLGTLGRGLQNRMKEISLFKRGRTEVVKVRAKVENIMGYSAHKDSEHLIEFIEKANDDHKLKKVFVCMGEPRASLFLAQRLRDYIGVGVVYPELHKAYEL